MLRGAMLSQNNCHPCVNHCLFKTKTNSPTNTRTISSCCWPTFHYYIKVVNSLSSRVFGRTHVFPPILLFHSRQCQPLSKVVKFCPWRQFVSHFHPLNLWCGTTTWNKGILRADKNDIRRHIAIMWFHLWWCSIYTYYPCGIHSSCRASPFNTTFSVWTPEGSSRLGILTGGASSTLNKIFFISHRYNFNQSYNLYAIL